MTDQMEPLGVNDDDMRKLYISNLKPDVTKDDITSWFKDNLKLTDENILNVDLPDPREGTRIKIAFVLMDTHDTCDVVLKKMRELDSTCKELKGNTLNVKRAVPSKRKDLSFKERTNKMFIAGIQKSGDIQEELEAYLHQHAPYLSDGILGKIEKFHLIKEKETVNGEVKEKREENKGFGFMTVETQELADKLAIQFHEFSWSALGAEKTTVTLKKCVPKDGAGGRGRGRGGGAVMQRGRGGRGGYAQHGWHGPPQTFGQYGAYGGYPAYYGAPQYGGGYPGYEAQRYW